MADVRYLYLLHTHDVRCASCGDAVVDASPARPQLRVAVGANRRPIRLPAIDEIPVLVMSVRCRCGRDVFYGSPTDALPLLTEHPPEPRMASTRYVLAGA